MRVLMTTRKVDEQDRRVAFAVRWVRALAARVEHLTVICQERGPAALPPNVTLTSLGKERGQGRARQLAAFYRATSGAVRRSDAIFCHMISRYAWLIAPLARLHGVPVVLWYIHRHANLELRLALALADRVVTAAPGSFPLESRKVIPVGHGIDTTLFHPADPSAEDSPPQVVMVARLSPIKHHRTMIEAAALLRERHGVKDVTFVAVGDEPLESRGYRATLEAEIARRGLEGHFRLMGAVPYEAVPDIYRRSAVALNLSPPGLFDKAALEAMLCARPVIVASTAFADLLGAHADKLLIATPQDAEGLAERLAALLKAGPDRRAQIGADLQRTAYQAHSLDGLMDRLVTVLAGSREP
jgi:glycosyltransferase involved in cell wall biosynthesis